MFPIDVSKPERFLQLLDFSLHSLLQTYGHAFMRRVVLHHPLRTLYGFWRYWRALGNDTPEARVLFLDGEEAFVCRAASAGERLLVGTGFCQKPLRITLSNGAQNPTINDGCPAGRFSHDCLYLSRLKLSSASEPSVHPACNDCSIRILGHAALRAGASFVVLTSALDIAHDILFPALEERRFTHILFAICPYSVEPMSLALLICGLEGYLFHYQSGSCANYQQWLRADRGDKPERTVLSLQSQAHLLRLLETIAAYRCLSHSIQPTRYQQVEHIFQPH
ncbi:MAG: hypothetical protein ACP5Q1_08845 [Anaerolineae bacterium]